MKIREKLLCFLSSPEISAQEIAQLRQWIKDGTINDVISDLEKIRYIMNNPSKNHTAESAATRKKVEEDDYIVDMVANILVYEAKMTKRDAMVELASSLGSSVHFPVRISFEKAILQLLSEFSSGKILNSAKNIRNKKIHSGSSFTWPLRDAQDENAS